jgi:hypothetical protein
MTIEQVEEIIEKVFSDTSCSQQETQDKLERLAEYIQACLAALNDM